MGTRTSVEDEATRETEPAPADCAACGGEGTVQDDPEPGVHGPAVDCRDCGGAGVVP